MRLFAALLLPADVQERIFALLCAGGQPPGGLGATWQRRGQLHATLRFYGEVEDVDAEHARVARLAEGGGLPGPFRVELGQASHRGSATLRLIAPASDAFSRLVAALAGGEGAPPPHPHVTLGRLGRAAAEEDAAQWAAARQAAVAAAGLSFEAREIVLLESMPGGEYRVERTIPL